MPRLSVAWVMLQRVPPDMRILTPGLAILLEQQDPAPPSARAAPPSARPRRPRSQRRPSRRWHVRCRGRRRPIHLASVLGRDEVRKGEGVHMREEKTPSTDSRLFSLDVIGGVVAGRDFVANRLDINSTAPPRPTPVAAVSAPGRHPRPLAPPADTRSDGPPPYRTGRPGPARLRGRAVARLPQDEAGTGGRESLAARPKSPSRQ